jgi:hypothetical protein
MSADTMGNQHIPELDEAQLPKRKHDGKPRITNTSRAWQRGQTMSQTTLDVSESTELENYVNALESLADIQAQLDEWKQITVYTAREHGESWQAIGNGLGITKQAAQQRYGKGL